MSLTDNPPTSWAVTQRLSTDPRNINAVNFVAIYGQPNHGKTSLGNMAEKMTDVVCISGDAIIFSKLAPILENRDNFIVNPGGPGPERFNIFDYINSKSYDEKLFINLLKEEIDNKLKDSSVYNMVLLEGYVFKNHKNIFSALGVPPERTHASEAVCSNGRYIIEGFDVTGYLYNAYFSHVRQILRDKCEEITIPKSKYQNFQTLGIDRIGRNSSASDTATKYEASHLDNIVQPLERFADVGCNAGYFCFRVAEKTRGLVVGIDTTRHWLDIASHINNSIFLHDNVFFIKEEAKKYLFENIASFDIVHCASTYHYFRDRQVEFLQSAHHALSPAGMLVLEVELAEGGGEPEVTMRSRGVDSTPCAFPNRAMFLNQIRGLFQVKAEFPSAFQRGSFYPRTYFHLRRV